MMDIRESRNDVIVTVGISISRAFQTISILQVSVSSPNVARLFDVLPWSRSGTKNSTKPTIDEHSPVSAFPG